MEIAGVTVPKATKRRHAIDLVELADGTRVSLPALFVNGALPGPRLYLGAAIHGDEVNGVAILSRVLSELDPSHLVVSIVAVLVQNPLAFHADHRLALSHYLKSPLDQAPADPWTCFPGNAEGSLAEKIAHILFGLIRTCDYAIDLHTPTRGGRYVPISILPPAGLGEASRRAEELAVAFGAGYVVKTDKGMYVARILCRGHRAGILPSRELVEEPLEPDMVDVGSRCVWNAPVLRWPTEGRSRPRARCAYGSLSTARLAVGAPRGGLGPVRRRRLARITSVYFEGWRRSVALRRPLYRSTTLSRFQRASAWRRSHSRVTGRCHADESG